MFYKIVSNGEIIDVADGLTYCFFQTKNGIWLCCDDGSRADGIVSSDGSAIYQLETARYDAGLKVVKVVEIDEGTYNELREKLIESGVITDIVPEPELEDPAADDQEPVAKSALMIRVEKLEAKLDYLSMMDGIELPDEDEEE